MKQYGIELVIQDKGFQEGLARYVSAQKQIERVTQQATQAIGVSWNEAAKHWQDASGKFVKVSDVVQRLEELKSKFPPVASDSEKAGQGIKKAGDEAQKAEPKFKGLGSAAEQGARQAGAAFSGLGRIIETALGTALGLIGAQLFTKFLGQLESPLTVLQKWGSGVHELGESFGFSDETAAGFAAAMKHVGMEVEEGYSGISFFIRQLQNTKDQMSDAAETYGRTAQDISKSHSQTLAKIAEDWQQQQADAAENIAAVWSDLAEKKTEIETGLAERVADINDNLQQRLSDIAEQRAELVKDTANSLKDVDKSLAKSLKTEHDPRKRRELKQEAAERKQQIREEAAEREKALLKQEQREREAAAKQIALAERTAAKQIETAERAAEKQVAAIEKGLARQGVAMTKAIKEANAAMADSMSKAGQALSDVTTRSQLSKGLKALGLTIKDVTDEAGEFTEEGLYKIMDAFKELPEGVKSSAVAMQLFGKGGMEWMAFLRQGSQGLEQWKKNAIALGLGVRTDEIKKLNRATADANLAFTGLGVTLGQALLPIATTIFESFNKIALQVMPLFQDLGKRMSDGLEAGGVEGMVAAFQAWWNDPKVQAGLQKAGQIIGDMFGGFLKAVIGAVGFVGGILKVLFNKFTEWANGEGKTTIDSTMQSLGKILADSLAAFLGVVANIAGVMWSLCSSLNKWMLTDGKAWFGVLSQNFAYGLIEGIKGQMATVDWASVLYDAAQMAVTGLKNSIMATLPGQVMGALGTAQDVTGLKPDYSYAPSWMQDTSWMKDMLHGLFGGSKQTGGPIPNTGMYRLHAGEYVLNPQQTRMMMPLLAGATTNNYVTFSHQWTGSPSSFDRRAIERIAEDAGMRGMRKVIGGRRVPI